MAFSLEQQFFINQYRSFFSMRTQMAAGSSFQLKARLGDEELWEDLRLGLNFFNTFPPIITTFTFRDLYDASASSLATGQDPLTPENETDLSIYMTSVMMCAMFMTGVRLQWFEAGKHFRYSDNGISIERVKQPDYANVVAGSIMQYINTVLLNLRKTLGFSRINIKGQFSGMISMPRSLTRGLRGTRLGAGS
jgi:hypothetical protein